MATGTAMRLTNQTATAALVNLLHKLLPVTASVRKGPSIVRMLQWTAAHNSKRLPALVEAIVVRAIASRRGSVNAVTRADIVELDRLLIRAGVTVPALADPSFLQALPDRDASTGTPLAPDIPVRSDDILWKLKRQHMVLGALAPHARGYEFEKFLSDLFEVFELTPRGSFRVIGDQIEGSFQLDCETYLLAAKWRNAPIGAKDLVAFTEKVRQKAFWTRGVFISNSGFCADELITYGKHNPVVCIDGLDLSGMFRGKVRLDDMLRAKIRQAAETGRAFARIRGLPGLGIASRRSGPGIAA